MRSTAFPFSLILKSILKSLIFIYLNLNYYRHSVSIYITVLTVEPLSVLSNQSLDGVLPFFILVFNFFYEIYQEFLVHLIARLIWQNLRKVRNFGME